MRHLSRTQQLRWAAIGRLMAQMQGREVAAEPSASSTTERDRPTRSIKSQATAGVSRQRGSATPSTGASRATRTTVTPPGRASVVAPAPPSGEDVPAALQRRVRGDLPSPQVRADATPDRPATMDRGKTPTSDTQKRSNVKRLQNDGQGRTVIHKAGVTGEDRQRRAAVRTIEAPATDDARPVSSRDSAGEFFASLEWLGAEARSDAGKATRPAESAVASKPAQPADGSKAGGYFQGLTWQAAAVGKPATVADQAGKSSPKADARGTTSTSAGTFFKAMAWSREATPAAVEPAPSLADSSPSTAANSAGSFFNAISWTGASQSTPAASKQATPSDVLANEPSAAGVFFRSIAWAGEGELSATAGNETHSSSDTSAVPGGGTAGQWFADVTWRPSSAASDDDRATASVAANDDGDDESPRDTVSFFEAALKQATRTSQHAKRGRDEP